MNRAQIIPMGLLSDIQESLLQDQVQIGPILLKFRLLAARLGSQPLQEWIKYELEGYPNDVEVPDYRKLQVSYRGTFSGPFGSGINNAPIPPYLIEKHAGEHWTCFQMRQSIAAVDGLAEKGGGDGTLRIDSANLIILLQDKIYEGYACNDISGVFSVSQLRELQHSVKSRLLELLIEFENIPGAAEISVQTSSNEQQADLAGQATQIFHQTIHGPMTNINNSGSVGSVNIDIKTGDEQALANFLFEKGIAKNDAAEFSQIIAAEQPESATEPFGEKAKEWIAKNIKKAANGTWKAGLGVATDVLKQAALKYYGLS